jgi:hypothetical protein
MSDIVADVREDVTVFLNTFGEYHQATPNENQYILNHIMKQIDFGAKKKPEEYMEGERGYESVTVFQKGNVTIKKRIFHPRDVQGVDFLITKYTKNKEIGFVALQVKRNHGNTFFDFQNRDINQLRKFYYHWPNGYYLFVNEVPRPPSSCFVRVSEVLGILVNASQNQNILNNPQPTKIPNNSVENYCRGLILFYDLFYSCNRGEKSWPQAFIKRLTDYVKQNFRIVVELLAESVEKFDRL